MGFPGRLGKWLVETGAYHVLSERLREADVVPLLDEVAHGKRVLVNVARREPLVRHVKEREVPRLLDGLGDLLPLLLRGVHTGGVMRASMEQEDAPLGRLLDVLHHALKVEPDGLLVVVPVLLDVQAGLREDGVVVGPRRVRDVDVLGAGVEGAQEGGGDAQGAGARDGLGDGEAVEGRVGLAVGEARGGGGELGEARDAGVLLVQLGGDDLLLGGADRGEDVGLASVIAVGADAWGESVVCWAVRRVGDGVARTEVDLLVEGVGLEGLGDACGGLARVAREV